MECPKADVITISRQFGSGGSYLGHRLAWRLGYAYADRKILRMAAKQLAVDVKELAERDERLPTFWEKFVEFFAVGPPEVAYSPPPPTPVSDEKLVGVEQRIIRDLAERGGCVIVGHAAGQLLKGNPRVLNIFIHAPLEYRVTRVMKLYKVATREEARVIVEQRDRNRGHYIRTVAGIDWNDARKYHLSINLPRIGLSQAEDFIASLAVPKEGQHPNDDDEPDDDVQE